MYSKPNMCAPYSTPTVKNDLYRKFRDYFIGATEKEFRQFDSYGREGYVSVNPIVEERIMDTLAHSIDEIVPIIGPTGIGKTYLLLYCLKSYYDVDDIPTNHPTIFCKDGSYDLVYYSDFNITEQSVLKDLTKLMHAKVDAMLECIRTQQYFVLEEGPDIDEYIQSRKLEVKYYEDNNVNYEKSLFALTALLSQTPINNVVFIFDDLESLVESEQFTLMEKFLTLYENFKSKSERKFQSKFLFCLRNNTYYNIYRNDIYNTHRASKAAYLSMAPSLSQIFDKRFKIILNSEKVKKAKNETTWSDARDILTQVAQRVDDSYTNLLIKLNNNNVSNALDDFLNILSNRRWTQRNANPSGSFKIDAGDYYINDRNILRILSLGEQSVYYQTPHTSIRCILPNPGISLQEDLIALLVLRAFRFSSSNYSDIHMFQSRLHSVKEIADLIIKCIVPATENDENKTIKTMKADILKSIQTDFTYYEENRLIRKNTDPEAGGNTHMYFMLPRGEQIFDLFFSQSILFMIFRDAFLWDESIFDVRCSVKLSFEELLNEALKFENQLYKLEVQLFKKVVANGMLRSYVAYFGTWSASASFLKGIEVSAYQYYKNSAAIPDDIRSCLLSSKRDSTGLVKTFEQSINETSWFD